MDSILDLPLMGTRGRILQLTDTHLFANEGGELLGINTNHSYQSVLDEITFNQQHYDLIVATGDLAQDQSVGAYQRFTRGISQIGVPCVWLPGNHDFQPAMVNSFKKSGLSSVKTVLLGNHWVIVLLDSQVMGVPYGRLSEQQLYNLDTTLTQYSNRHALVLLHHHPLPSGCDWLDQHSLQNSMQFDSVLSRHPQVKVLLCGHIHQELDLDWQGRRVLATPSTCVQFKPQCANFTLDNKPPGWRHLNLLNTGEVETEVCYLKEASFSPNMNLGGY